MNTNAAWILGIAAFFAVAVAIAVLGMPKPDKGATSEPAETVSNVDDEALRLFAQDFGSKFKNVALLADDAPAQMEREYGPYVAPELLGKWQANAESAPGRQTSSPWPDSLEVVSIEDEGGGTYVVRGNVIEVVSGSGNPEPVAVYPVTMAIAKNGATMRITAFEKGSYSELPKRVTVTGVWECLPHADRTGPQTDECALGIAKDEGGHLAVDTALMSAYPVDFPTGTKVRVEGIVTPIDQLSADHWRTYDIDGIIRATVITEVK